MSKLQPKYVLRHRENGRIFGYTESLANEPSLEKVKFVDAFPEKCMPAHIESKVASKKAAGKKNTGKKGLDLSTPEKDIDKDPEEILEEDDLSNEINQALSADASVGLS